MGSSILLHMQAMHYHLQNATIASQSWRHQTPNPTGKHAKWWTKVYGSGLKDVRIVYRAGKTNLSADALSRSPQAPPPTGNNDEVQVAVVTSQETSIQ